MWHDGSSSVSPNSHWGQFIGSQLPHQDDFDQRSPEGPTWVQYMYVTHCYTCSKCLRRLQSINSTEHHISASNRGQ
ncbi:hypothetical protein GDO78_017549 [Eleutherodactylus coqui]|uniref:Uncharacterized protein n=1 Tax=Eleutherodactylus coqui TaxID=57060 RepID=A0A8J6BMR1_ELECQ|nr:hypothetical protein GDO78_017549 [Eleutherodactylus coqui]